METQQSAAIDYSTVDYFTVAFSLPPMLPDRETPASLYEVLGRVAERNARTSPGPRQALLDQAASDQDGDELA